MEYKAIPIRGKDKRVIKGRNSQRIVNVKLPNFSKRILQKDFFKEYDFVLVKVECGKCWNVDSHIFNIIYDEDSYNGTKTNYVDHTTTICKCGNKLFY